MNPGEREIALFQTLNGLAGNNWLLDNIARIFVGDYFVPVLLSLSLLALWFGAKTPHRREGQQRAVLASVVAIAIANLVVFGLNGTDLALRPRPFDVDTQAAMAAQSIFYLPPDPAFPSNSMAVGFAIAVSVMRANRPFGIAMVVIAGMMGLSRVYAGVHFPADVIAGATIGLVASGLALVLLRLLEPLPTGVLRLARRAYIA